MPCPEQASPQSLTAGEEGPGDELRPGNGRDRRGPQVSSWGDGNVLKLDCHEGRAPLHICPPKKKKITEITYFPSFLSFREDFPIT